MDWKIKPAHKVINITPLEPEPTTSPNDQKLINHYQSAALGLIAGLLIGWWLL